MSAYAETAYVTFNEGHTGLPPKGPDDIQGKTVRNCLMPVTVATYPTVHGPKYLQQLCKHFAHKVAVTHDETTGRAVFPTGTAEMSADETAIRFRIEAPDAKSMIQARFVIDSHLVTFAHREHFTGLTWQMVAS